MITRESIMKELFERGYEVEAQTVVKNGVVMNGILFKDQNSNVAPVIYVDEVIRLATERMDDLVTVVNEIVAEYEKNKNLSLDINMITDKDFILEHLVIGLKKEGTEPIVKRKTQFEGIEQYLFVSVDEKYSYKIRKEILEARKIALTEAWRRAEDNTFAKTTIRSMAEVLGFDDADMPMYIISGGNFGASAILDKKSIKAFAEKKNINGFVVLPSSVHEMILIPEEEGVNYEWLCNLVAEVNETQVDAVERLTDRAYKMAV